MIKKQSIVLIILIFQSISVYSQDKKNKIGIVFSNNYSRLENLHLLGGQRLRASYQYGFGMNGNFGITKKWNFEIGWMYSFRGNITDKRKIQYGPQQVLDSSFPTHTRLSEDFEFIDLPIKFFRNFNTESKVNQFISFGIVPTFNLNYKITSRVYFENRETREYFYPENKLNSINALFLIGYGFKFKVYNNISSQIEMNVKRSILNVYTEESKLNNHFWEAGISTFFYLQ